MPTNKENPNEFVNKKPKVIDTAKSDDIIKVDVPPYINDTLRLFYAELQKGETDYAGMLTRLAVIIDSKARADEREKIKKVLNDLWDKEGKNIDNGVYAYPFEAMREMIIREINRSD